MIRAFCAGVNRQNGIVRVARAAKASSVRSATSLPVMRPRTGMPSWSQTKRVTRSLSPGEEGSESGEGEFSLVVDASVIVIGANFTPSISSTRNPWLPRSSKRRRTRPRASSPSVFTVQLSLV